MGIKHFWIWFKEQYGEHITTHHRPKISTFGIDTDMLAIDMNGIFHTCAQKVFRYGNYAPRNKNLITKNRRQPSYRTLEKRLFEAVATEVDLYRRLVNPKKRLLLCVDGIAGMAKMSQQRQRRFRSAKESSGGGFDSDCITPGTRFMNNLSKYLDWYIRMQVSVNPEWQHLEVIFSNEKVPGEGEAKCLRRGTSILLWNGAIKTVENIKVGEQVIGDDGTPRTVTDIVTGDDEMYEISQNNAENYTVNKHHILSLKIADHKRVYWSERDGGWIVGWYDRNTNKYRRKQFSGLRENEKTFMKMTSCGRTCVECNIEYTTRENYGKHMKREHNIVVPKMKTRGRATALSKSDAYTSAISFVKTIDGDDILDISVETYIKLPTNTQRKLYGFRCPGVSWPTKKVELDPYLLGLWLGDGIETQPVICNIDIEVVQFLEKYCKENNYRLSHNDKYITYRICDDTPPRKSRIMTLLKKYDLIKNKHIPREYLVNDRPTRLKVLAGIIDSDGNVSKKGRIVCISQCLEHKQIIDDTIYLARSLGFCVNKSKGNTSWVYNGEKKRGECYFITISGDIHLIPTLINRKICSHPPTPGENGRSIVVDKLRTSIKVRPVGQDTYYGFNTDGNHRFLLGDFTVTHNCVRYLRKYRSMGESCCIHGMDADLIMLGLASPCEDIYIVRDDSFKHDVSHVVNLGKARVELSKRLNNGATGNVKHINDFLLMCYAVGNDFLPHAPGIEILSGGIDTMIEIYNDVEEEYGYLSRRFRGQLRMCKESFSHYLEDFSSLEEEMFNKKLNGRHSTFPDPVMDKYIHVDSDGKKVLNIEEYKKEYYATKFPNHTVEQVCNEYIFGMRWVLDYYTSGIPMWSWCYPWHYSPFMSDVAKFMPKFSCKKYCVDEPFTPFQQLMTVLPEKSAHLLPAPIGALMKESSPVLGAYFPADFEIDMAGKRREWEGIVLLPKIDKDLFFSELEAVMPTVDPRDLSRNKVGKIFSYSHIKESRFVFKSYYGDITENYCDRKFIDF